MQATAVANQTQTATMITVLIATERETDFNVLSPVLAAQGFRLLHARDGLAALDALRQHAPQVLLANVLLPKLDGFSLFRRCRQDEQLRGLPIVLFSTRSNDQKSQRFAADLGIKHFVGNALKADIGTVIRAALVEQPAPLPEVALAPRSVRVLEPLASAPAEAAVTHTGSALASAEEEVTAAAEVALPLSEQEVARTLTVPVLRPVSEQQAWELERAKLLDAVKVSQQQVDRLSGLSELFALNPVAMWVQDAKGGMLAVNNAALRLFGYEFAEFIKLHSTNLLQGGVLTNATQVKAYRTHDGKPLSLLLSSRELSFNGQQAELVCAHDVGYRVRGERAMAEEVRKMRALLSALPVPYLVIKAAGVVVDANELAQQRLGYSKAELQALPPDKLWLDDAATQLAALLPGEAVALQLRSRTQELWPVQARLGTTELVTGQLLLLEALPSAPEVMTQPPTMVAPVEPLSRLPVVLEVLRYAEDADENTLLHYATAQMAHAFGSGVAVFGALDSVTSSLRVLALAHSTAHRTQMPPVVKLPAPWASLVNAQVVLSDMQPDEAMLVTGWPELSSYAVCSAAVSDHDRPAWLLAVANRDAAYTEQELADLKELGAILAALLQRKRNQAKQQALRQRQLSAYDSMLSLLERLIEQHDVYAQGSGHRVASLCAAIAAHLQLATERSSALLLAARLHDVGHLSLPKELLLLPRAYTMAERNLMQTHVEQGMRLLRSVDFGQEVTGILAQHHERLDGTGYPAAAKGEQVCLEARILAVADVVEAITATRAYRSASELSVAMAELRTGAGSRYDATVVAACERVFAETQGGWPAATLVA